MLIALYDKSSVEIEGKSEDLLELSRSVRECRNFCRLSLSVPASFDYRGLRYLRELIINVDSSSLRISEKNQNLVVSGAKENLDLFSDNIDWLLDSQKEGPPRKRDHLHVEFYPGHFFLSEDALPVVLVRQD